MFVIAITDMCMMEQKYRWHAGLCDSVHQQASKSLSCVLAVLRNARVRPDEIVSLHAEHAMQPVIAAKYLFQNVFPLFQHEIC